MPNTKVVQNDISFAGVVWHGERVMTVTDLIRDELLKFSTELDHREPTQVIVEVSPNLANELGFGDPSMFDAILLGVPVRFSINWALLNNFIRLTIS